jgi:hypothetical protein
MDSLRDRAGGGCVGVVVVGADTFDITGLSSDHRIVFDSNGGVDTVIGAPQPQDVFNGVSSFGSSDGLGALAGGIHQFGDLLREMIADDHLLALLLDQRSPSIGIVRLMHAFDLSFGQFAPMKKISANSLPMSVASISKLSCNCFSGKSVALQTAQIGGALLNLHAALHKRCACELRKRENSWTIGWGMDTQGRCKT